MYTKKTCKELASVVFDLFQNRVPNLETDNEDLKAYNFENSFVMGLSKENKAKYEKLSEMIEDFHDKYLKNFAEFAVTQIINILRIKNTQN